MWIMTTDGFFSAVQHRDEPDTLLIRARDRADLEALVASLDGQGYGLEIIDNPPGTSDYPARVFMSKGEWAEYLRRATDALDYANFKDAVKAKQGKGRANVYMGVWSILHRLTPGFGKDTGQDRLWGDERWSDIDDGDGHLGRPSRNSLRPSRAPQRSRRFAR